jgi:transcriptional regulator CtsR
VVKMARLSDIIEAFLKDLMMGTDGPLEIQRNELAIKFKCVPSQINYVIDTRFTTEKGYYVESRRGGGGYIKIKRIIFADENNYVMHIINSIGKKITQQDAEVFITNFVDYGIINIREAFILKAVVSDKNFLDNQISKDNIRAEILKSALMSLVV